MNESANKLVWNVFIMLPSSRNFASLLSLRSSVKSVRSIDTLHGCLLYIMFIKLKRVEVLGLVDYTSLN